MRSWRRPRFWRGRLARGTTWLSSRRAFPRQLFRCRRLVHRVVVLRVNYRAAHKEQRYPQHPNNAEFPVSNDSVHAEFLLPLLRIMNAGENGRGLHDRALNNRIATVWSYRPCASSGSSRMNHHRNNSIRGRRTS